MNTVNENQLDSDHLVITPQSLPAPPLQPGLNSSPSHSPPPNPSLSPRPSPSLSPHYNLSLSPCPNLSLYPLVNLSLSPRPNPSLSPRPNLSLSSSPNLSLSSVVSISPPRTTYTIAMQKHPSLSAPHNAPASATSTVTTALHTRDGFHHHKKAKRSAKLEFKETLVSIIEVKLQEKKLNKLQRSYTKANLARKKELLQLKLQIHELKQAWERLEEKRILLKKAEAKTNPGSEGSMETQECKLSAN